MKTEWVKTLIISAALLLAGCSSLHARQPDPYDWSLHAFVPKYSPAYVQPALFLTTDGKAGAALNADYPPQTQSPNGWKGVTVDGMYGISLAPPKEIDITWTPLATKETWTAYIKVPHDMIKAMKTRYTYKYHNKFEKGYLNHITVGVTPDGYAKLFLLGDSFAIPPIKTRSYALVKGIKTPKLTPYANKEKNISKDEPGLAGSAVIIRSMKDYPEAQAYIARYGIPKGPW